MHEFKCNCLGLVLLMSRWLDGVFPVLRKGVAPSDSSSVPADTDTVLSKTEKKCNQMKSVLNIC